MYPYIEQISTVPNMFELLKFDHIFLVILVFCITLKSFNADGLNCMKYICIKNEPKHTHTHTHTQEKIFRHKRLSIGANFVYVYIEIWDKGFLKFNKFSV